MLIVSDNELLIREMTDSDDEYSLLLSWLNNPTVSAWYENTAGLTMDAIRSKYRPRIVGESHIQSAIIEWKNRPIGYLQYYEARKEMDYAYPEPILEEPNVWGIDMFIGESDLHGKGIGSATLSLMMRYLMKEKGAQKIIMDPDVRNERAVRAYEKAGFKKVKILKQWEQHGEEWSDAWLMVYEKP
ncbi:MAG: GNAT family N-acetyltransferase [Candidatus Peregrinibacteria bacterium]